MNGLQLFAFVALPVAVAVAGWIIAFLVAPAGRSSNVEDQSRSGPHRHHA